MLDTTDTTLLQDGDSADDEVAVVAAGSAWPLYQKIGAYLCQNGRPFRDGRVRRFGFYSSWTIHPAIPLVLQRFDDIEVDATTAAGLLLDVDPLKQQLGRVVAAALDEGWYDGVQSVFLLSPLDDPRTYRTREIRHSGRTGWSMHQRYARLGSLLTATTTADLEVA